MYHILDAFQIDIMIHRQVVMPFGFLTWMLDLKRSASFVLFYQAWDTTETVVSSLTIYFISSFKKNFSKYYTHKKKNPKTHILVLTEKKTETFFAILIFHAFIHLFGQPGATAQTNTMFSMPFPNDVDFIGGGRIFF